MGINKAIIEIIFIAGSFWLLQKSRFVIIDYFENTQENGFVIVQMIHLFMLGVYWFCKPVFLSVAILFFLLQLIITISVLMRKGTFLSWHKRTPVIIDKIIPAVYILYFFTNLLSFMFK